MKFSLRVNFTNFSFRNFAALKFREFGDSQKLLLLVEYFLEILVLNLTVHHAEH